MSKLENIDIAVRVRELRINAGLSQEQVSTVVGISRAGVAMVEGGNAGLSIDSLIQYALLFKTTTDYILGLYVDIESNAE